MTTTIVPSPLRTAVDVSGLRKGFSTGRTRIEVLRGVDLHARGGEILLLVGPSGCGKTTLLTLIAGLLDPDAGSVKLWGQALEALNAEEKTAFRKEQVGFVFQQFNLIPTLTIRENAAIPLLIRGLSQKQALDRAGAMLEKVGLGNRLTERPGKLSGGQQQRVAIARALVGDPKLLICDEPTASLDGETGAQVMEILRSNALQSERCTIVVTHDQRIFKYGDRIAQMRDGVVESMQDAPQSASVRAIAPAALG
ncbi:MAG: ABC transporter ATP-binding protein [Planctomycetota bacterium]|nr:ABC transporter ATP-binding protein [Planctomycetota bacterium]